MNNFIERKFAAVTDRRYKNERKLRTDSILGGLPAGQRAMVDKWLFDKGMTYSQVAEACGKMFGVKVSKSSVGRYFQSVSKVQSPKTSASSVEPSKVGKGAGWGVSEKVGEWVGETGKPLTEEEAYQELLAKVRKMAFQEANLPAELRDGKFFCALMRILIAARRERNQAVLAAVERKKFEVWAAGKVLKHLRCSIYDLRVEGDKHPPSSDFGAADKRGHGIHKLADLTCPRGGVRPSRPQQRPNCHRTKKWPGFPEPFTLLRPRTGALRPLRTRNRRQHQNAPSRNGT